MDGPDFQRCSAQLHDLQGDIFEGNCGNPETPDAYTYVAKHRDIKNITIDMETAYSFPPEVPRRPSYLERAIVGNVKSYTEVTLYNNREHHICPTQFIVSYDLYSVTSKVQ